MKKWVNLENAFYNRGFELNRNMILCIIIIKKNIHFLSLNLQPLTTKRGDIGPISEDDNIFKWTGAKEGIASDF